MNILPFVGRRRSNNLVKPSLRVQIIPRSALPVGTIHAFLLVTETVEGYGLILSIRLLLMLSPMDILKSMFVPGKVPPIDSNFFAIIVHFWAHTGPQSTVTCPHDPDQVSSVLTGTIIIPPAPSHRHF